MVESLTKPGPLEKRMANHISILAFRNPMNSMKRQKDRTLRDELPRLAVAQYATGEEWRNNCRKKEETEPKWKQHPVADVTGDGSNVQCYKEQYCMACLGNEEITQSFLRLHSRTAFWTLLLTESTNPSISSKGFLPTVVDIMVI